MYVCMFLTSFKADLPAENRIAAESIKFSNRCLFLQGLTGPSPSVGVVVTCLVDLDH